MTFPKSSTKTMHDETNIDEAAMNADWYVLQIKPNGHRIAVTNLARQGFHTLMPMQEVSRNTRFGLRSTQRPLFPGYLFFSVSNGQINWRAVGNTRGVTRIVTGTDGQPGQLPHHIADELLRATNGDGTLKAMTNFEVGENVSVIHGPLSGWLAKVIEAGDADRVRLLIDVMGRMTPVSVARKHIEKANV